MKTPLFIACADLHLMSGTPPVCRTETEEEFEATMWRKVTALKRKAQELEVLVLYGGDTFDTWRCGHDLVANAMRYLPSGWCVAGQHEIPYHDAGQYIRSPLAPLREQVKLLDGSDPAVRGYSLYGASWNQTLPQFGTTTGLSCGVVHKTIWPENDPPFPGAPASGEAKRFLNDNPSYDILITGDNHKPFILYHDGKEKRQLLVNCGSMLRLAADQADYIPKFHVVYDDLSVESIPYLEELTPISREHLDAKSAKDERTFAFLERLKEGVDTETLSFKAELEKTLALSDAPQTVVRRTWEIVGKAEERK